MNIGSLNMMKVSNLEGANTQKSARVNNDNNKWEKHLDKARKEDLNKLSTIKSDKERESALHSIKKDVKKNKITDFETLKNGQDGIIEQQIIAVLANYMQLPEQEIKITLEEMNRQPIELLEKSNFMDYVITQLDVTQEDMLNGTIELKNISKVFAEIEQIQLRMPVERLEKLQHNAYTVIEGQVNPIVRDVHTLESLKDTTEKKITYSESTEIADIVETLDLGIDIPIQMPTTIQKHFWQAQNEVIIKNTYVSHQESVAFQLIEEIDLSALRESNEITMQLTPRSLGKLSIRLSETQGIITAQIQVENEKVKESLLQDISILKEKLEAQGLQVGSFQVDVKERSDHSAMDRQKQKSSKRIQEIMDKQLQEVEEVKKENIESESESAINLMA